MKSNSNIFTRRNIFVVFTIIFAGVLMFVFFARQSQPEVETVQSPLKDVPFPIQTIPYPADWLNELHYPGEFQLVDTSFGTLPNTNTKGFAAKLRYQGAPQAAVDLLLSFLSKDGWEVAERSNDGGGILILIQNNKNKSGIVIIDSDSGDLNKTIILVTIFP